MFGGGQHRDAPTTRRRALERLARSAMSMVFSLENVRTIGLPEGFFAVDGSHTVEDWWFSLQFSPVRLRSEVGRFLARVFHHLFSTAFTL